MSAKRTSTRKYGDKASSNVGKALHAKKKGTLKSGSGRKVTSKAQAIAIALSEARKAGGKVPRKSSKRSSPKRKASGTAVKRKTTKRSASKRGASKRSASKRTKKS